MTVTKRIKTVQSLVPCGARLLDVGSDHGLLPISLYNAGVIKEAVISDINKGPLESGKSNVARLAAGLKASFVLSDGFLKVKKDSYDVAAICGMGGELIARIIEQGGDKALCPLILQPMTHAHTLRGYLWSHGFDIKTERFALEGSRVYCIMLAEHSGNNTEHSYTDLYLGKDRPPHPDFAFYATKVAEAAEKRLYGYKTEENEEMIGLTLELIKEAQGYIGS